jgi:RNA polymerase sigma factor (sigma-70 family)
MDDEDLSGLIEQARTGDEAAVGDLMRRFESDVRMMVRVRLPRALRSQFDSMDFVQSVWQSVFTGPDRDARFASIENFRGYLAGVARNKVFEEYRRRTQTKKFDIGREEPLYIRRGNREVPREVASPGPSPSQEVQAEDRLAQLIEGRPPQEAEVIELRRRGLTFDEIAERTGLHERTVRRVIEAVRKRVLEERQCP